MLSGKVAIVTGAGQGVGQGIALALASKGWVRACQDDPALAMGINAVGGKLTYAAVGEAFGIESVAVSAVL